MGQAASTARVDEDRAAELKMLNDDFIEAEIVLKNLQIAQENAVKLVQQQERFAWEFAGVSTMVIVLLIAGGATKRKDFAVPIAPLVMGLGYRYFCAFGESSGEIRDAAESLLRKKDDRLRMPGGPLTLREIDAYRERHFQ